MSPRKRSWLMRLLALPEMDRGCNMKPTMQTAEQLIAKGNSVADL